MFGKHAVSVVTAAILTAACSVDDSDEPIAQTHQAVVGGSASDNSQDATVMLFLLDPTGPRRLGICTATLVAPRLVLTARHCVASADEAVACDVDGTPLFGGRIIANHDPADLYVFTGKNRPALTGDAPPDLDPVHWNPAGRGQEIIDDNSGTLCNHDLAFLLLKEPIVGVPIASLRLDGDVVAGEKVRTVGWGVSLSEVEPKMRQQRGAVTVKRVGPSEALPVLTKSEFLFDESICLGDSGGPVFAEETNALVGVVSRGGNGLASDEGSPSSTCVGADNVATKISPFTELAASAFERAGAEPRLEQKPENKCSVSIVGTSRSPRGVFAAALGIALLATARRRRSI